MAGIAVGAATAAAVLGGCGVIAWLASGAGPAASPPPPDLLMRAVVERNADLGWQQLCPAAQAQLPLALVRDQAAAQRMAEANRGMALTLEYVGARPVTAGGELRVYLVTAHLADGAVERRTYTIRTGASGCVESVD